MKQFMLGCLLALGVASAQSPFVDVPPCHWAADAITRIAGQPEVDLEAARKSQVLVENSLRQVFEGFRCNDLTWTASFLRGIPDGVGPSGQLSNFTLSDLRTSLAGDRAQINFVLATTIDNVPSSRAGTATLVFEKGKWFVEYASLAELGLSLLPRQ